MKCIKCWYDKLTFNPLPEEEKQGYRHYYVMNPHGPHGVYLCKNCYENFESEEKDLRQKYNLPV